MTCRHLVLTGFSGPQTPGSKSGKTHPEPTTGEVGLRALLTHAAGADLRTRKRMYRDLREKPASGPGHDLAVRIDALAPGLEGGSVDDRGADAEALAMSRSVVTAKYPSGPCDAIALIEAGTETGTPRRCEARTP
jgi:hypothetical protein